VPAASIFNLPNFAPLRLGRYFSHNDSGFVANRIRESNVQIAARFNS
jgi:hypothetical protein